MTPVLAEGGTGRDHAALTELGTIPALFAGTALGVVYPCFRGTLCWAEILGGMTYGAIVGSPLVASIHQV
jgi:hypothetical protein